jgi:hypothetical protein
VAIASRAIIWQFYTIASVLIALRSSAIRGLQNTGESVANMDHRSFRD